MRDAGMPPNANSCIRPCRIRHMASRMHACSVTRNEQRLVASTRQPAQRAGGHRLSKWFQRLTVPLAGVVSSPSRTMAAGHFSPPPPPPPPRNGATGDALMCAKQLFIAVDRIDGDQRARRSQRSVQSRRTWWNARAGGHLHFSRRRQQRSPRQTALREGRKEGKAKTLSRIGAVECRVSHASAR